MAAGPKPQSFSVAERASPQGWDVTEEEEGAPAAAFPPAAPGPVAAFKMTGPKDGTIIETVNLNKYYGSVHALRNLNLQVYEGDIFGFLGPNGAGKTTFTKCLMGFIRPTSGFIYLFGKDASGADRSALDRVGIVPDQFGFYDVLSGRQHLQFYGRLYGITPRDLEARIEELTKLVRMEHRMEARVRTYSHGMRQRLVIASALLNDPDLIVFDEPTTGLDPKGAHEVKLMLKDLAKKGVTTFLSSHVLHEVEEICTKVGILNRGVMLKLAPVSELRKEFMGMAGEQVILTVDNPGVSLTDRVASVRGVQHVAVDGNHIIATVGDPGLVPQLVSELVAGGGKVRAVQERVVSLEEMFLHFTDDAESPGSRVAPKAQGPVHPGGTR